MYHLKLEALWVLINITYGDEDEVYQILCIGQS